MQEEAPALPAKVPGLQPWELTPTRISLLGSGRCQLEGESDLQAFSSPAFSAARGPGQGPRGAAICCGCIQ